jgi:hypothetical protein
LTTTTTTTTGDDNRRQGQNFKKTAIFVLIRAEIGPTENDSC